MNWKLKENACRAVDVNRRKLPPGFRSSNSKQVCWLRKSIYGLRQSLEKLDLGPLKYFLGIEVARNSSGLFLSQRKLQGNPIEKQRFGFLGILKIILVKAFFFKHHGTYVG
ncbi:hypothetical protein CRG98_016735 [Punica granatum]|uniref:Reverse transcriptase Ty1/copia-type domain-containing protein n=1 Tax=Punica granatum TaxID=22663 RepID=A0A2I0K2X8_PUNGR|nr:hypothetical protein CRG98_016735 [Punica granatum]